MPAACRAAPLVALLLVLLPARAHAESGQGAGFGPVLGVTLNGSVSLGWELAGSFGVPLLRLSTGGSYQIVSGGDDAPYFHYLAWEPWLYVGGTLGVAVTDVPE